MRQDIVRGARFPDYLLPDHTKTPRRLFLLLESIEPSSKPFLGPAVPPDPISSVLQKEKEDVAAGLTIMPAKETARLQVSEEWPPLLKAGKRKAVKNVDASKA